MLRPNRDQLHDEGFTLIEVVAALSIMVIVSTAALYFFVNGTRAVTQQQRTQDAVTVANEAMESAYGVVAKTTDGISGVLAGRPKNAVDAAWAIGVSGNLAGINQSYEAWDTTVAATADPAAAAVPIKTTPKHSNITYTAYTVIGACYRSNSGGPTAACSKLTGYASDPGTAPSGYARIMRVMVLVTWPSTTGTCAAGTCSFQTSSLIDPNDDQVWNNTTKPIAVDDAAVVYSGQSVVIDVLGNDIIGPVTVNPVNAVTVTSGTGTAALQGDGSVKFTAPSTASGKMTFTYYLKDGAGRQSNTATVTVSVMPVAVNDTAKTSKNKTIVMPVTANDLGSPASVTITTPVSPSTATATVSGTSITFNPKGHTGTFTLQYTFTDGSGLVTDVPATVTVTVTAYDDPLAADLVVGVPAKTSGSTYAIDMSGLTGNDIGYIYNVLSGSGSGGKLTVGNSASPSTQYPGTSSGTYLAFAQQGNTLGVYTFTYTVSTPDKSVTSGTKTVTIVLVPQPANDGTYSVKKNNSTTFNVGTNDAPNNYGGTVQFQATATSSPTCGTLPASQPDLKNGIFSFKAGSSTGTCTFTYVIQGTGDYTSLVSAPATVTVKVTT